MGRRASAALSRLLERAPDAAWLAPPRPPRPLADLSAWLQDYHRRLGSGQDLPTVRELADFCLVDRPTLYDCMRGERISERARIRLSIGIDRLEAVFQEVWPQPKGRLVMKVHLGPAGPSMTLSRMQAPSR